MRLVVVLDRDLETSHDIERVTREGLILGADPRHRSAKDTRQYPSVRPTDDPVDESRKRWSADAPGGIGVLGGGLKPLWSLVAQHALRGIRLASRESKLCMNCVPLRCEASSRIE